MNKTIPPGRVFKSWSTSQILRFKTFLLFSKFPLLVSNLNKGYSKITKIIGTKIPNKFIDYTYGDLFIGGKNTTSLQDCLKKLNTQGYIGIADFAIEFLGENEEDKIPNILKSFLETIDTAYSVNESNMIAIKVSSLISVSYLKKLNSLQHLFSLLETAYYQKLDYESLKNQLNSYKLTELIDINKENYDIMLENTSKLFKVLDNKSEKFRFNLIEYMVVNDIGNYNNNLVSRIIKFDALEFNKLSMRLKKLYSDINVIISHSQKTGISVMIDAEQTYLQTAIDYLVVYLMKQYNIINNQKESQSNCVILNTCQMYLKDSLPRLNNLLTYCQNNSLSKGVKLVRGAYMVEEARIASEFNIPNPICSDQKETDVNYNAALELVYLKSCDIDKAIFATHNYESICYINELFEKTKKPMSKGIVVAQLMGIGQHAAWLSKEKLNFKTAKYIPFGDFDILLPYLFRRAEESSILSNVSTQTKLVNSELKERTKRFLKLS